MHKEKIKGTGYMEQLKFHGKKKGVIFTQVDKGTKLKTKTIFMTGVNPAIAESISEYIQAPTIVDSFTAHGQRRDFTASLYKEDPILFSWYETNRLRFNHLYTLVLICKMLEQHKKLNPVIIDLNALLLSGEAYNALSNSQQVVITRDVAIILVKLYKLL